MISIVITSYNREKFLAKAIESILAQTYTNFELIIWDDGSTDNSVKVAQKIAANDSRITIRGYRNHQGVSKSVKDAIALTTGKYIGWVDSDDWIVPECLELLISVLENRPNLGVIYSDYIACDEQEKELGISRSATIPYSKERLLLDMMSHHFRLIRRSEYDRVGGIDTDFKYNYDFQLCLKLSEVTSFEHFPQVLYYRRMHKESITGSHRAEQIQYSVKAVQLALVRRGLDKQLAISACPTSGKLQLTANP